MAKKKGRKKEYGASTALTLSLLENMDAQRQLLAML